MPHILVANVGSTSLKYKLVVMHPSTSTLPTYRTLAEGAIERIGIPGLALVEHLRPDAQGILRATTSQIEEPDYASAIDLMLHSLTDAPLGVLRTLEDLDAIAFKAVHGGS